MAVLIIAEAGVNHNGKLKLAKNLVDAAVLAKADVIKFQTFKAENIIIKNTPKAPYQDKNYAKHTTQYNMLKELELTEEDFVELCAYSSKKNILFCSSPFDIQSVEFLHSLKHPFWKIASGEITNYPLLKKIGSYKEKVIMSTGMATLLEIENAVKILMEAGTDKDVITLMHCNTEYPTSMQDVNLRAMKTMRESMSIAVGYSDHTLGIEVPIAAVALGASVIEKHFTLSRALPGPDHKASLEPQELSEMVQAIRNIEAALGTGIKKPTEAELKNLLLARKSIVASRQISKGECFSEGNLTVKRPGNGMSPIYWDHCIGRIADREYDEDEMIDRSTLSDQVENNNVH